MTYLIASVITIIASFFTPMWLTLGIYAILVIGAVAWEMRYE